MQLLGVQTVEASSRIRCCIECAGIPTCIGAAWKRDGSLCQVTTDADNIDNVLLHSLAGWEFYVKDQYICGYISDCIDQLLCRHRVLHVHIMGYHEMLLTDLM